MRHLGTVIQRFDHLYMKPAVFGRVAIRLLSYNLVPISSFTISAVCAASGLSSNGFTTYTWLSSVIGGENEKIQLRTAFNSVFHFK